MVDRRSEPLVSVCRVKRGLYALRYLEASDNPSPRADVAVLAGSIVFVAAPGRSRASLTAPGQCIVVAADEDGEFEIRVVPGAMGGTDAKLNLELLDEGEEARSTTIAVAQHGSRTGPSAENFHGEPEHHVSLIAHVSRRGDVSAGAGDWIAGPDEVLPIEGLALSTGSPDLSVRIRVQSMRGGRQWSRWYQAEEFAGSRQQADPLTAISLELYGSAAARYEIVADAMHLGNAPQTKMGQMVEFFGVDPIVGFRFRLNPGSSRALLTAVRPASPLRVFRAKR